MDLKRNIFVFSPYENRMNSLLRITYLVIIIKINKIKSSNSFFRLMNFLLLGISQFICI